jgi:hypothetical protein
VKIELAQLAEVFDTISAMALAGIGVVLLILLLDDLCARKAYRAEKERGNARTSSVGRKQPGAKVDRRRDGG